MRSHEIVWNRARSRVEGGGQIDVFIAAVPGGHLISTKGPGAPGLCFVPGKARAIEKLIVRAEKKGKKGKTAKKKAAKPKPRKRG